MYNGYNYSFTETAVGFHSLMTTTHPPNINLPSSGQQVTARLSARKVYVTGGTGPKTHWSGTLQLRPEREGQQRTSEILEKHSNSKPVTPKLKQLKKYRSFAMSPCLQASFPVALRVHQLSHINLIITSVKFMPLSALISLHSAPEGFYGTFLWIILKLYFPCIFV
jgi:hypothetical protein